MSAMSAPAVSRAARRERKSTPAYRLLDGFSSHKIIRSLFSILLIALKFHSIELFNGLHDLLLIFADLFKKRFVRQRNGAAHSLR